jgi:hypothetical protein
MKDITKRDGIKSLRRFEEEYGQLSSVLDIITNEPESS